jgi:hypothetical protein
MRIKDGCIILSRDDVEEGLVSGGVVFIPQGISRLLLEKEEVERLNDALGFFNDGGPNGDGH